MRTVHRVAPAVLVASVLLAPNLLAQVLPAKLRPPPNPVPARDPTETQYATTKAPDPADAHQCRNVLSFRKELSIEELAALAPNAQVLWPGALVQGNSAESGVLTPVVVPRPDPITVSVSGRPGNRQVTPSPSNVESARLDIVGTGFSPPVVFSYEATEFHSLDDAMLSIGAKASWMGNSARASLTRSDYSERTNFVISFVQSYYTYTVDPATMTLSDEAVARLPAEIDPAANNPLAYVASVTYGRRAMVFISSALDGQQVKSAAQAAASWIGGSADGTLDAASTQVISQSDLKLLVMGGNPDTAVRPVAAADLRSALRQELSSAIGQSGVRYGVPISYRLNFMDHSAMRLAMATEFQHVDRSARPMIGTWTMTFQTANEDKDHDSLLTAFIRRRSDGIVVANYAQQGSDGFANGSVHTVSLAGPDILAAAITDFYGQVCINTNGHDHWVFGASLNGTVRSGGTYVVPFNGDLDCRNCNACMDFALPVSVQDNCQ